MRQSRRFTQIGRQPMFGEQFGDRQIVGVVRLEPSRGIDDGIDRVDGAGRSVELIDQGNAGFLERHRDRATANSERANAAGAAFVAVNTDPGLLLEIADSAVLAVDSLASPDFVDFVASHTG